MNIVDKILVDPITRGLKFFTKGGVPAYVSQVRGRTDGSAVPAGYVGEVLTAGSFSNATAGGSTTNTAVGSLVLTAGTWLVSAVFIYNPHAGTVPGGQVGAALNLNNNIFGGQQLFLGEVAFALPTTQSNAASATTLSIGATLINTTGTTIYLNAFAQYSGNAPAFNGKIRAVRIA